MNPRKILAYVLLLAGLAIASAGGARNGEQHVEYRQALWTANETGLSPEVSLPAPGQRLAQWWSAGGLLWAAGVVLITGGALYARKLEKLENSGEGADHGEDAVDFLRNIQETRRRLDQVASDIAGIGMDEDVPQVREEIDRIQDDLLHPIVEARGRFMARHGVGVFASYFGSFSGGERNLARTWSALTDGHAVEARASLEKAREAFADAEKDWLAAEET